MVRIAVLDNGPGFSSDALEQVFDPYVTTKPKGTGLGLAIVKKLVEEIGAKRLMWGTDMPNVERFCTYRQSLEMIRRHMKGLMSNDDITDILGATACRLYS